VEQKIDADAVTKKKESCDQPPPLPLFGNELEIQIHMEQSEHFKIA
jgi:hypothetical protein